MSFLSTIPRQSPVIVGKRLGIDYDRWLQQVATRLDALATVIPQGPYANPNTNVVASPGALYTSEAGGAGVTLWVKESGVNTSAGWVAK